MLIATGKAGVSIDRADGPALAALRDAVTSLAQELAQMIVRDGEGATKFDDHYAWKKAATSNECRRSPMRWRTRRWSRPRSTPSDPNLGRILAAVGYAGVNDLDVDRVNLRLDDVWVARDGGRNPDYREEDGQRVMKQAEITVRIALGRGNAEATV